MIQGGGFEPGMKEKPTRAPIQNEAKNGLKNVTGSIAMARTPNPHSASAQFFINLKDNSFLDYPGQDGWGYAVFGKVVQGRMSCKKSPRSPPATPAATRTSPLPPSSSNPATLLPEKK